MLTSFYTAAAGAVAQQQKLDVVSNNIANASTAGYQPDRASFADLLYTGVNGPETADSLKVGHGSRLGKTDTVFGQGSVEETGRPLDYALTRENAFFAVRGADGRVRYTRAGSFELSRHPDGRFYLADPQGALVLDRAGRPIAVEDESQPQDVGVFSFRNCDGLRKTGDSDYEATEVSGPAAATGWKAVQRSLEGSAVDFGDEMTAMINAQKGFAFNAKVVEMSDNMVQTVNNLR